MGRCVGWPVREGCAVGGREAGEDGFEVEAGLGEGLLMDVSHDCVKSG